MSRCTSFPKDASDLSKNFDCIETIVRGESTVYQVICTRGRLRGRILALKKVSRSSKLVSASLHQTLHHPNIASLYFITSALSSDYLVLEYCSEGNLSDLLSSRNPSILSEAELRRVLKGVGSALVYLKEERVIHRNICPSTIFFAEDLKPKLSNFEQAVRLPQGEDFLFSTYEMATYPPPEPLPSSQSAYNFAVDIWSLGCTAQRCIYGKCHAPGHESHVSPPEGNYNPHFQDLLMCLLENNHVLRMDPSQILKHPFITDDLIVQHSSKIPGVLSTSRSEKSERVTGICEPPLPPCQASPRDRNVYNRSRPLSALAVHLNHLDRRQAVLGDISNINMKKPNFRNRSLPARRVFSDPVPSKTPYCIAKKKPTNSDSTLNSDASLIKEKSILLTEVLPVTHDIALPYQNSIPLDGRPQLPIKPLRNLNKIHGVLPSLSVDNNTPSLPIGTTRPQPINTLLLVPKTHKLANGSLIILPSHSLLVDFRENQRRRGQRGDEVLLIDPTGTSVKVFNAPHLSVPTCLIEPRNEYTIDTLPSSYWKVYNNVYDLIRQIKQRTPQLIMNTNEAKCTLMANAPMGDIELVLNRDLISSSSSTSVGLKSKDNSPSMRIRYSRQQCLVEFSQHVVGSRGSEWKKRVKACTGDLGLLFLEDDLSNLERKALHLLADFLQTCQKLELSAGKVLEKRDNCTLVTTLKAYEYGTDSLAHCSEYKSDVLSQPPASTFEIKFIQSTGWCIKRLNKESKAVYNMLFLDGTSVTIDGAHVEFTAQSGNNLKCRIFESYSHEEVGPRMKFFNDFVRLFD